MTVPGFVVGLAIEARVLARALRAPDPTVELHIACAAANEGRAGEAARQLLAEGAEALVSFGIAGGLDPALMPGDLVLAEAVRLPDGGQVAVDPTWRARWAGLAEGAGLRNVGGRLAGSRRPITGVADKRHLYETAGAIAVDMESHAVAAVATDAGVPFLVVRAIADPAGRPLPLSVVGSTGPDGRTHVGYLLRQLCLRPWEVPELLRLRKDARAALSTLSRLAGALGPAVLVRGPGGGA